jgi:hypothetical protein
MIYSNIGLSFRATVPLSIRYTVPYHTMELLNDNRHNFFCKTISNEHTLMTAACYFFCREREGGGGRGGREVRIVFKFVLSRKSPKGNVENAPSTNIENLRKKYFCNPQVSSLVTRSLTHQQATSPTSPTEMETSHPQ